MKEEESEDGDFPLGPRNLKRRRDFLKRVFRTWMFIVSYKMMNNGNSPTYFNIMSGTDITSKSVVRYHVHYLKKIGLIRETDNGGLSRDLELVGFNPEFDFSDPATIWNEVFDELGMVPPLPIESFEIAHTEVKDE